MQSVGRQNMSGQRECFGFRFKKHMIVVAKDVGESETMFRHRYWWIAKKFEEGSNANKDELIIQSRFMANERFLKVTYQE